MKHTKGEWGITIVNQPGYGDLRDVLYRIENTSKTHKLFASEEHKANARLIASAPDLLEACEEFVRKCDCGEARSVHSYAQMKKAIKKAKGAKL